MTLSTESFDDERIWPTWYTVQVWNGPGDLFMRTSYPSQEVAVEVAKNLSRYYEGRMEGVTLKRWNYIPTEYELTGDSVV
jgi:hypothetical protein